MYEIVSVYNEREIRIIRNIVENQTRSITGLEGLKLENYHSQVDEKKHREIGNKKMRVMGKIDAAVIEKLDGTCQLISDYKGYRIGEIVYNSKERENRPEFYFRLVRPSVPGDVGPPHCDYWFDEAVGTGWGLGNTIKFWIPILIEPGLNGLYFYPHAPREVPFKIIEKDGFRRPLIDMPIEELGVPVLPCPALGQALKFSDDVLHAGAPNKGKNTRVSMEITLVRDP